jgi:hypothetical protein
MCVTAQDESDATSLRGMALRPQTRLFFAGEGTIKVNPKTLKP